MQTVKILVGFFLIIVLIGCRNTESHSDLIEINIEQNVKNVKPLNICDFNGELRYVSLKDNSILLKVAAESEFSGDKILVSDRTNCLLYDYQGNRLAIIGRKGKGPGEYNLIMKMKYCMASIYKLDGKTSFKEILNDTLFRVNDQFVFEPSYFLNLGKYKLPKEVRELPGAEMNKERKIYIFISKIFESSNYLFLDCNFQDYNPEKRTAPVIYKDVFGNSTEWWFYHAGMLGVYEKPSHQLTFAEPVKSDDRLTNSGLRNDYDGGVNFFKKMVNDSTLAMWVDAWELKLHVSSRAFKNSTPKYPQKKKELERLANSLSDNDNPVLILCAFKR